MTKPLALSQTYYLVLTTRKGYRQAVDISIFLTPKHSSVSVGGPENLTWDCVTVRPVAGPLPGFTNPGFAGSSNLVALSVCSTIEFSCSVCYCLN
jgi:hypothetical protein